MRAEIANQNITFPDWIDEATLLKNAESTNGKFKQSVDYITNYVKWRTTENPIPIEEVQEFLGANMMY
jgi:hypothetical protein